MNKKWLRILINATFVYNLLNYSTGHLRISIVPSCELSMRWSSDYARVYHIFNNMSTMLGFHTKKRDTPVHFAIYATTKRSIMNRTHTHNIYLFWPARTSLSSHHYYKQQQRKRLCSADLAMTYRSNRNCRILKCFTVLYVYFESFKK